VFHHTQASLPPNWIGTTILRLAELSDESGQPYLTLGPEDLVEHNGSSSSNGDGVLSTIRQNRRREHCFDRGKGMTKCRALGATTMVGIAVQNTMLATIDSGQRKSSSLVEVEM